jgi:hypothetical protein
VRRHIALVVVAVAVSAAVPACSSTTAVVAPCGHEDDPWIIIAQSVPSATFLPCVQELPTGWMVTGSRVERGSYTAWLDSDRAGIHALEIRLTRTCDVSRAVEIPVANAPTGVRTFEQPMNLSPFVANRFVTFEGGCITYSFRFTTDAPATLALEVQQALDVRPREDVRRVLERLGLRLCGAGAPPCPG